MSAVDAVRRRAAAEFWRRRAGVLSSLYDRRLENRDFTLISGNCFGAEIYRHLGLPYTTPFVGMFIEAPCFMKILGDLRGHLEKRFEWTDESRYEDVNAKRRSGHHPPYPIGVLGDAEVHFLHYRTAEEAADRWYRRVERIRWDNLAVAYVEYGARETEALPQFETLGGIPRKVFLAREEKPGAAAAIRVHGDFGNAVTLYYQTLPQFDIVHWLNTGEIRRPPTVLTQWRAVRRLTPRGAG